jgi:ParB/RepB/Spo0J family partition protein
MSNITVPEIEIDKIDIEEGFNARRTMDPAALERLAKSMRRTGSVEPLVVKPTAGGRVKLVAGERRLRAAQLAELKKVPVVDSQGRSRQAVAYAENRHREDLDSIEEAIALRALGDELKLTTNKEIADESGDSISYVASKMRLLRLPEEVQKYIADGSVPEDAEPQLRKVAAVSPRVAECICEYAVREKVERREFVQDFAYMLMQVADGGIDDPPTMIRARSVRFSRVIEDGEKLAELARRYRAAAIHAPGPKADPTISLNESEIDAARAAGVLIELDPKGGGWYGGSYIVDKELAADLVLRAVEREEKGAKKRERQQKKAEAEQAQTPDVIAPADHADKMQAAREERAAARASARSFNDRLGHKLLKRRSAANRKKFALSRKKAIATALVLNDPNLASAGLRLVLPQLQNPQDEITPEGNLMYATPKEAQEYALARIEEAKSPGVIDELLADMLISAELADQLALGLGEPHTYWVSFSDGKVTEFLADEIKEARPRKASAKKG